MLDTWSHQGNANQKTTVRYFNPTNMAKIKQTDRNKG